MVVPISESTGTLESVNHPPKTQKRSKPSDHDAFPLVDDGFASAPMNHPTLQKREGNNRSLAGKLAIPCYATRLFLPGTSSMSQPLSTSLSAAAVTSEHEPLYLPEPLCQTSSGESDCDEYSNDESMGDVSVSVFGDYEQNTSHSEAGEIKFNFKISGNDEAEKTKELISGWSSTRNVDEWLAASQIRQIQQSNECLLSQPLTLFNATTEERIFYVTQREVAHVIPSECDVIMSDRATTCHILIMRSTTESQSLSSTPSVLVSCAHLDGPYYDSCLQQIFHQHYVHHAKTASNQPLPTYFPSHSTITEADKIQVEVHIAGGFLDNKGRSQDLSNWLLHSLAELAAVYAPVIHVTLRTCLTSMLNHDPIHSAPKARGLACRLESGRVFLARCSDDMSCMGPDPVLRLARLWSRTPQPQLILVNGPLIATNPETNSNTYVQSFFKIPPFAFSSNSDIPWLLSLDDVELLKNSSTSPNCEEGDYCDSVRQALGLLLQRNSAFLFSPKRKMAGMRTAPQTRKYQRSKMNPQEWILFPPHGKTKEAGTETRRTRKRWRNQRRENTTNRTNDED